MGSDECKAGPPEARTLDGLAALVSDPGPESNESNGSKVCPKARTFDALESFDSGPRPAGMHLLTLKSASRPGL